MESQSLRDLKDTEMWNSGMWVSVGLGSARLTVGLDLKGLSQTSVILLFIRSLFPDEMLEMQNMT